MEKIISTTDRLILRSFKDTDLHTFLAYRQDPEVAKYQSWRKDYSEPMAVAFINKMKTIQIGISGEWSQIAIELKQTSEHIGDCGLHVDQAGQQGEFGITIATKYQKKGYGSEALTALIEFSFVKLNLHRFIGLADVDNIPSVKLQEKLGMRKEAHFVESYYDNGIWKDEIQYAILNSEWNP